MGNRRACQRPLGGGGRRVTAERSTWQEGQGQAESASRPRARPRKEKLATESTEKNLELLDAD